MVKSRTKNILLLTLLLSQLLYAQNHDAHKYGMNTFKRIHIQNNNIFHAGLVKVGNDFFSKSNQGEDIEIQ